MKKILYLLSIFIFIHSCESIRVTSDFDENYIFDELKTYAYSKKGIDQVEINDLDKKRILKAIDVEMYNKGFRKSSINPDFIINFFTKTNQKIDFYPSMNYRGPYIGGYYMNPYVNNSFVYNEGVLFIDIIDKENNQLAWQGIGKGYISTSDQKKKNEKIKKIVNKILIQFPPAKD